MAENNVTTSGKDEFGGLAESALKNQIFRRFKSRSIVAKDWIIDLAQNGYRARRKGGEIGMYMSDEMPEVGVLSIAPALSALLLELSLLRSDEQLAADEGKKKAGAVSFSDILLRKDIVVGNKNTVLTAVVNSICRLLFECYPDGIDGNLDRVVFSSMPFYDDSGLNRRAQWVNGGYLDTASWVFLVADSIESFIKRLQTELPAEALDKLEWTTYYNETIVADGKTDEVKVKERIYAHKDGGTERIAAAVRKIYYAAAKVACDCIVARDKKAVGWSFRAMRNNGEKADPSLYFSYVASTVYLGLYKRFNTSKDENGATEIIDKLRAFEDLLSSEPECRAFEFYKGITDDAALQATIKRLKTYANDFNKEGFLKFASFLGGLSASERSELDFLYNTINGGEPLSYKIRPNSDRALFYTLKKALIEFSDMIWNDGFGNAPNRVGFKLNMAKGPCFEDGSNVDMDVLPRSSRDNSFFNNLFVIGILLNSAYDTELSARDKKTGGNEYEQMLNVFQLSIQNTQRCYNDMASRGLLYKIDSYILDFSERVDEENAELSKQLRRVNMAVVPLLPLMLKSNNLMSEYVVRYPQKQMIDSLKDIIRNRKPNVDGDGAYWVWDKDGYNAITNYYYIDALIAFYRYYDSFEAPCVENEEEVRVKEQTILSVMRAEKERELTELERQKQKQIDALQAQVDDVREIRKSMARFVVNGLIDLVNEQLTPEKLIGSLDKSELEKNDKTIAALKSINSDTDTVKVSTLIDVMNKLQLLSLITLTEKDGALGALLRNADENDTANLGILINKLFGNRSDPSAYIVNILKGLLPTEKKSNTDN